MGKVELITVDAELACSASKIVGLVWLAKWLLLVGAHGPCHGGVSAQAAVAPELCEPFGASLELECSGWVPLVGPQSSMASSLQGPPSPPHATH